MIPKVVNTPRNASTSSWKSRGGTNGQTVTHPSERVKIGCAKVYFGEISKECQEFEYEVQSEFRQNGIC